MHVRLDLLSKAVCGYSIFGRNRVMCRGLLIPFLGLVEGNCCHFCGALSVAIIAVVVGL